MTMFACWLMYSQHAGIICQLVLLYFCVTARIRANIKMRISEQFSLNMYEYENEVNMCVRMTDHLPHWGLSPAVRLTPPIVKLSTLFNICFRLMIIHNENDGCGEFDKYFWHFRAFDNSHSLLASLFFSALQFTRWCSQIWNIQQSSSSSILGLQIKW